MKQLVCEMCGGTDLLKQDGIFVCQSCGCKYSVEEAKKLMIEGVVEVSGKVAIDRSKEIENHLVIARRSFDNGQYGLAAQQYIDVLKNDPNNAEATFFSVLSEAIDCRVFEIINSANTLANSLGGCLKLVNQIDDIAIKSARVAQMVNYVILTAKNFTKSAAQYIYDCGKSTQSIAYGLQMANASLKMVLVLAEEIIKNVDYNKNIYKSAISCYEYAIASGGKKDKPKYEKKIKEIEKRISSNENKIAQIAQKKKIDAYWAKHQEEKQSLEKERNELKIQIKDIEKSMHDQVSKISEEKKNIQGNEEIKNYDASIQQLNIELSNLGLFKGKEKKALKEQIDDLNNKKNAIKSRMKAEEQAIQKRIVIEKGSYAKKIDALQLRIDKINHELTKER